MYETLKAVHVAAVVVSGAGFVARGALMLAGSPLLARRFVRVAPHVVDTVLLAAAVTMTVVAQLSPHAHPWLMAKIAGLIVYIALGAVALKHGRSRRTRMLAFAGALIVLAYIVGTALQRDPLWPLRGLA